MQVFSSLASCCALAGSRSLTTMTSEDRHHWAFLRTSAKPDSRPSTSSPTSDGSAFTMNAVAPPRGTGSPHGAMAQVCWPTDARNRTKALPPNRATARQHLGRGPDSLAQDSGFAGGQAVMTGIATWLATPGLRPLGTIQLLSSSSYPYTSWKTFQHSAILRSWTCMTSTSFPDQVLPFRVTESVFRTTTWSSVRARHVSPSSRRSGARPRP